MHRSTAPPSVRGRRLQPVAPSSRSAAAAFASAFADIGQRRAPTGHFFRNVAGQLNGQLLRFVATRNQK